MVIGPEAKKSRKNLARRVSAVIEEIDNYIDDGKTDPEPDLGLSENTYSSSSSVSDEEESKMVMREIAHRVDNSQGKMPIDIVEDD